MNGLGRSVVSSVSVQIVDNFIQIFHHHFADRTGCSGYNAAHYK